MRRRVLVPLPDGDSTVTLIADNQGGVSDAASVRVRRRGGPSIAEIKPRLHLLAIDIISISKLT